MINSVRDREFNLNSELLKTKHLWHRLRLAKHYLQPFHTEYRVIFNDPDPQYEACRILVPDPNLMAAAIHGNVLANINDVLAVEYDENGSPTNYHIVHESHADPMTEEEAIEYLIMKDIPRRVWQSNEPRMKICTIHQLPQSREYRNAWRLAS